MSKTKAEYISDIIQIMKGENITNFYDLVNYLDKNNFTLFKVCVDNPELVIALCND